MRNIWLVAIALIGAVAASAATARAAEFVAPVGATPTAQIAWGEAAGDLQLGVRFNDKFRDHHVSETAIFRLVLRNVGQKNRSFTTISPLFSEPFGTDEKEEPLTKVLKAPLPPVSYRFGNYTRSLAPGELREIDDAELRIGPSTNEQRYWALDGAPGNYRVGFSANFALGQNAEGAPLKLKSGLLALKLTADAPPRSRFYLSEDTYTWGREVNGLQLGIRLEAPGQVIPATKPVPLGTLVTFGLAVRNASKVPLKVNWIQDRWSISPRVTTETGEQLSLYAQAELFGGARRPGF